MWPTDEANTVIVHVFICQTQIESDRTGGLCGALSDTLYVIWQCKWPLMMSWQIVKAYIQKKKKRSVCNVASWTSRSCAGDDGHRRKAGVEGVRGDPGCPSSSGVLLRSLIGYWRSVRFGLRVFFFFFYKIFNNNCISLRTLSKLSYHLFWAKHGSAWFIQCWWCLSVAYWFTRLSDSLACLIHSTVWFTSLSDSLLYLIHFPV